MLQVCLHYRSLSEIFLKKRTTNGMTIVEASISAIG